MLIGFSARITANWTLTVAFCFQKPDLVYFNAAILSFVFPIYLHLVREPIFYTSTTTSSCTTTSKICSYSFCYVLFFVHCRIWWLYNLALLIFHFNLIFPFYYLLINLISFHYFYYLIQFINRKRIFLNKKREKLKIESWIDRSITEFNFFQSAILLYWIEPLANDGRMPNVRVFHWKFWTEQWKKCLPACFSMFFQLIFFHLILLCVN